MTEIKEDISSIYPLTLFWDAGCPVCALEMDWLRVRDDGGRLRFVDINSPGFDASHYGTTQEQMDAVIHAQQADGTVLCGLEVLRLAYEAVGLRWMAAPTRWPLLRPLFEAGYRIFARHRHGISRAAAPLVRLVRAVHMRRAAHRLHRCKNGVCAARNNHPRSMS